MNNNEQHERNTRTLGLLLLAVGAWILVARFIHIDLGAWLWPFWIIVPGGLIMALGFRDTQRSSKGLVTFGSIVAVTGIILFVQDITGQWQSWAYAWALLFPGSIGLGQYLWGKRAGDVTEVQRGEKTMQTAFVLFVAFGLFFEVVLGLGGFHLGTASRIVVPVLLIAGGAALYIMSMNGGRKQVSPPPSRPQSTPVPPQPPVQQVDSQDDITQRR
ncbi:hypothetical protein [Candidatus Cryosericum septentrionale]|jgi:hypothetical protein|uniref:DUF5668 domain-containing protein n=1 Tax=Candidatus Cryosericum septentrionale TaxID=2290913 RepID=A0A398DQ17_9BACT|nr:hypothetical protein [Candidatus Cryosericum septentrionale]RIE16323.1 hypothetical protein SMC1_07275 [Candidatus Cryosericum septentrionale]